MFVCVLGAIAGLSCASSQRVGPSDGRDDAGDREQARDSGEARIPDGCTSPDASEPVTYSRYDVELCPKRDEPTIVVHSEAEYLEMLACADADGAHVPSGIDWGTHELLHARAFYQGEPGRIVRLVDAPQGRVVQRYSPRYCGGTPPMEGEQSWSLLLPQREAGEVEMIACEPEPCDWEKRGLGPPP